LKPTEHVHSHLSSTLPCRLEYLQQKQSRVSSEPERKALEKQIREAEKEIQNIK
jgi:predicted DNA-binding protein